MRIRANFISSTTAVFADFKTNFGASFFLLLNAYFCYFITNFAADLLKCAASKYFSRFNSFNNKPINLI